MLNPGTALADVVVDELIRGGVTEAVVSPGSRSGPVALALSRREEIRIHVRIDERSAAFLALGIAKLSGNPVLAVCTSGTAAANFHPAVLEASYSNAKLVLLTCDRPPELRATGANQTVDQTRLYGNAVRFFAEFPPSEARKGMNAYWRSAVCRGLSHRGPVHFNVPFRAPFLHDPHDMEWPEPLDGREDGAPWVCVDDVEVSDRAPRELADPPERGLLVIADGADDPASAVAFAESLGWPIFAEPGGNGRVGENAVSTYSHLLGVREVFDEMRPDLIVTTGRQGLSRPLQALYPKVDHIAVSTMREWPDPTRSALRAARRLPRAQGRPASSWLRSWQQLEAIARSALDAFLDATPVLTELRLARDLAAQLDEGDVLFIGPSSPIRYYDFAAPARRGPRVVTNRGVSGIDGCVSTAVGMALAHQRSSGRRAFALLGDLTFLHDQNGILTGPGEPDLPLAIIVVNNGGGGFFSQTPYAALENGFEQLFTTPQRLDLSHTAAAAGWQYRRIRASDELPGCLDGTTRRIVEVRADSSAALAQLREVHSALVAAVRHAWSNEQTQ